MNEFIFRNTTGNSLLVHCIFSCMNEFNFLSTIHTTKNTMKEKLISVKEKKNSFIKLK